MKNALWCLILATALAVCGCADDTRYPWQCVTDKDCASHNPCLEDKCLDSICTSAVLPDDVACDDGNVCTLADSCQMSVCKGQEFDPILVLKDTCLVFTCDPQEGYLVGFEPNGTSCATGACNEGVCLSAE